MQKNTSQAIYNSDVFLIQSRIMVCICRNIKYIKKKNQPIMAVGVRMLKHKAGKHKSSRQPLGVQTHFLIQSFFFMYTVLCEITGHPLSLVLPQTHLKIFFFYHTTLISKFDAFYVFLIYQNEQTVCRVGACFLS